MLNRFGFRPFNFAQFRALFARTRSRQVVIANRGKAAADQGTFMRLRLMMTWWLLEPAFTFHASVARPPAPAHQQARPVLVSRGISDEARDTIIELVQLDFELVADSLQRRHPIAAWELAQSSFEKRWPLLEWTLKYNMDRTALNLVERATNCTVLRAMGYAELDRQRSHLTNRLTTQRSHLAMALIALRPALRQRLVEAIAERPSLLPSVGRRSLGSGILYSGWPTRGCDGCARARASKRRVLRSSRNGCRLSSKYTTALHPRAHGVSPREGARHSPRATCSGAGSSRPRLT